MDLEKHAMTPELPNEIQFNGWVLKPKSNYISFESNTVDLEPLLFDLLVYFALHQGEIITRQDLITYVWKQKFVDDNSINRAMSALRRVLKTSGDSAQAIKTHYKKGYSFTPDVIIVNAPQSDTPPTSEEKSPSPAYSEIKTADSVLKAMQEKTEKSDAQQHTQSFLSRTILTKKGAFTAFFSAILVVASLYVFNAQRNSLPSPFLEKASTTRNVDKTNAMASRTNLLNQRGLVFAPKVNRDKTLLAYSFMAEDKERLAINVKNLKSQRTYVIAEKDGDLFPITWFRNERLIYQLINVSQGELFCEVWSAQLADDLLVHSDEKLFDCDYQSTINGSLIEGGKTLVYTKYNYRGAPVSSALFARNLETNKEYQITSPHIAGHGDYYVTVSHDEKQIAYARSHRGGTSIMISDIDGSEQEQLIDVDYMVTSISWNAENNAISWFDPVRWELNTLNLHNNKQLSYALNFSYAINQWLGVEVIDKSRFIFANRTTDADIIAIDLVKTNGKEERLDVAVSGSFEQGFASTGEELNGYYLVYGESVSVWRYVDGIHVKVKDVSVQRPASLSVSPDKQRILIADSDSVMTYDLNFELISHLKLEKQVSHVQWLSNEELIAIYGEYRSSKPAIISLSTGKVNEVGDLLAINISRVDNNTIAVLDSTMNVSMIDVRSKNVLQKQFLESSTAEHFAADTTFIYFTKSVNEVYRRPWNGSGENDEFIISTSAANIRDLNISTEPEASTVFLTVAKMTPNTLYDVQLAQQ
ncbi:MAG: hypothetical protein CMK74_11335 [Pseudomonadales bacterium]|nr:hypothetical protein [Pseudomonadales bacterium]